MKTLTIYKREVLERTGFKDRRYRFKEVTQVVIHYCGEYFLNGHSADVHNPYLRVKFNKVLETRSKKAVEEYISKLGRTDADKFIKSFVENIIK